MAPLPRKNPLSSFGACLPPLGLFLGMVMSATASSAAIPAPGTVPGITIFPASELAAELSLLPDASSAEAWLAQHIPNGTTLADQPRFFGAAHETYFDGEDGVLVFVYRSAAPGRWAAWVSFDAERIGVIDTSATDL